MAPDLPPPQWFSREFHTQFFPQLLKKRLRLSKKAHEGTSFTSTTEMFILLVVCVILAIIGIPLAVQKSVIGWILSILGAGGIIFLVITSFLGQRGTKPSYDDFLIGVFLFFVILGVFIGIPVGMETHRLWLGLSTGLAGLIVGYFVGMIGGWWLQYLGWFAIVINILAAFGAIILSGTAVVLLVILAFP